MQPANRHIPLPEIAVTDWLNKLGEPAFVAWLRFRTWRDHDQLKIPIRQIIQKLGVANKTFYSKIFTPLWEHGLVETHPSTKDKRLLHLHVYDAPQNVSEKASLPIERIRTYQPTSQNGFCSCNVFPDETITRAKNETVAFDETNTVRNVSPRETNVPENVAFRETFSIEERSPYLINQDLLKENKDKRDK